MINNLTADRTAANEGKPRVTSFGWASQPTITMGTNPRAASLPGWYTGTAYPEWPVAITWAIVTADGAFPQPQNTRVCLRNIRCAMWSISQQQWIDLHTASIPLGGQAHDDAFTTLYADNPWRAEADGISVRPAPYRTSEVWGKRVAFDLNDLGGIYASLEHKLIIDD